jgi:hypothetical protein
MSDYKVLVKIENYFALFHILQEIEKRITSLKEEGFKAEMKVLKEKETLTKKEENVLEKESDLKMSYIYISFEKRKTDFTMEFMGFRRVSLTKFWISGMEHPEILEDINILLHYEDFMKIMKYLKKNTKIITINKKKKTTSPLELKVINRGKIHLKLGDMKAKSFDIDEEGDEDIIPMDNLLHIEYPILINWDDIIFKRLFKEVRGLSTAFKIEVFTQSNPYLRITEKGNSKSIGEIINEISLKRDKNDDYVLEVDGDERDITNFYLTEYYKSFIERLVLPKSIIKLRIKLDHPLRFSLTNNEYGYSFESFLAPRIDEQDYDDDDEIEGDEWTAIKKNLELIHFL